MTAAGRRRRRGEEEDPERQISGLNLEMREEVVEEMKKRRLELQQIPELVKATGEKC